MEQLAKELQPRYGPVRFHRVEELEEQFTASTPIPAVLSSVPQFFEVQGREFQIVDEEVRAFVPPGVPTLYIAASPDGSRIYKLAGFPEAEEEFSRLVAESPAQRIIGPARAETRGLLCAELVYGLSAAWWIADASNAKIDAAKYFFDTGHENAFTLAERWWRSFSKDGRTISISTARSGDEFTVNLPVFWGPVEGSNPPPQIKLYSIKVSGTGTCHSLTERTYK